MATYSYSDVFLLLSGTTLIPAPAGTPISAWKASRFGSPPAYGTAFPSGTADASTTVTSSAGSLAGAFTIALPTAEPYYIAATSGGNNSWKLVNSDNYKDGTSGSSAEIDPGVVSTTVSGDLSGTLPSPTVAKVSGVAIGSIQAAILSQLQSVASHGTSATANAGETSICTAAVTITLPSAPFTGTINTIVAQSGAVTIQRGGSDTISHYATTALTSVKIPTGMTVTAQYASGAWTVFDGGFVPGTVIGTQQYAPGTLTTYTVSATSLTALDATNAISTFIGPPSGNVDVAVTCTAQLVNGASGQSALFMGLLNNSGGAQVGNSIRWAFSNAASFAVAISSTQVFHLTGLTAGTSYQLNLAAALTGSASGQSAAVTVLATTGVPASQGAAGPLLIQARAA